VTEREPCAELQQPRLGSVRCPGPDPEPVGRPSQQRRASYRLGSGQQEQASGRLRERRDPPLEALPDPASQQHRADHAEPAASSAAVTP
jgi:hypothetical protein